jgi:transposase
MRPVGTKAELEQRRRLAVALYDTGMTVRDVAEEVGCAPGSVSRWMLMRAAGGDAALDPIPNAGSKPRLGELQQRQLCALLSLGARTNGFATDLWTLSRVRAVIAKEFGVEYSISNVHVLLGKLGFSNQAAAKRSREQDPEAVREFREKTWPALKKKPRAKVARSR